MTYSAAFKTASTMSRVALCALLGLCLTAGLTSRAGAIAASSPFVVTRTADDTLPGSLRAAIAAAAATGGTVTFAIPATDPGYDSTANTDTITLALGPLIVPASLTIVGPTAPSATVVVSGAPTVNGFNMNASRVFSVTGGTVAFSNLAITNGNVIQGAPTFPESGGGGGILNAANLTLTRCTVTGNSTNSGDGSGINNGSGASLTMTGCTISGNSVGMFGLFVNAGGIANSGTLTATGCLISGNSAAGSGGGLFNSGTATLNSCTLSGNGARSFGGGQVFGNGGGASNSGSLTLNNSLVTGNGAIYGGGLFNDTGGTLALSACTLSGNSSANYQPFAIRNGNPGYGGGSANYGTAVITDCLVVGNRSDNGDGLYNGGTLTLINSTFTGNSGGQTSPSNPTPASGGLSSGPATLVNDIFYGDAGVEITAASGTAGPNITYSDVQGGYAGTGNIDADPQFVRNADPNASPADPGDEHLKLTSPAVYAGTNGPGVPLTDIEGTPRPTPPAKPSMGAYEVPGSATGFSAQGGFLVTGTQNLSTGSQVVAKFLPGTTPVSGFTASVAMGDGSVIPGVIVPDPTTAGVFDVTVSYTYAAYGTFTVAVTISGPNNAPTATVTSTATIQPAQVAADVTGQVSVLRGGLVYNRASKRYVQTVTIKNTGIAALAGPFSLVLDALTPGATLVGPTGTTQYAPPAGSPYQNAAAGLAPGASLSLVVQLTYAGTARFGYTPRVLAGPGAR